MTEVRYEMQGTHMEIYVPEKSIIGADKFQGLERDIIVLERAMELSSNEDMKNSYKQCLDISKIESDQGREF